MSAADGMYRTPPTPAQVRALDALVAVEMEAREAARREAVTAAARPPEPTLMDSLAELIRLLDIATGCHAPRNLACNQEAEAA